MNTPRELLASVRATLTVAERDLADGRLVDFARSVAFAKSTLAELDRKFSGNSRAGTGDGAEPEMSRALVDDGGSSRVTPRGARDSANRMTQEQADGAVARGVHLRMGDQAQRGPQRGMGGQG